MTAALERCEWSAAGHGRFLSPGKIGYPFYRRLDGTQGRSGRAEKLVPTGIRSPSVQPVSQSLYRLSYPSHTWTRYFSETKKRSKRLEVHYRYRIHSTSFGHSCGHPQGSELQRMYTSRYYNILWTNVQTWGFHILKCSSCLSLP